MEEYKISFCTTCMNRVHHLKETLSRNIYDNRDYPNLEFVLLDYNSEDNLADYVLENLSEHLVSGRLVYYRTETPKHYNMSHSRNVAYKLANGDIVCNIDADNFTGAHFAHFVNQSFRELGNIFLSTHYNSPDIKNDVLGRICVKRSDFLAIGGYEERMKYYGFDDFDFAYRLELFGVKKQPITNSHFLHAISHSNKERMANGIDELTFNSLLIRYESAYESELIIMFTDFSFKRGRMINTNIYNATVKPQKRVSAKYDFSILEENWIEGKWERKEDILILHTKGVKESLVFQTEGNFFIKPGVNISTAFYVIESEFLIEEVLFFYQQLSNRIIMEDNLVGKKIIANPNGFGKDIVYKNFDSQNPIIL